MREDNVLFMISIKLKDICNEYGVFILTARQLNADYTTAQQYHQNLLLGAKSFADKIDLGLSQYNDILLWCKANQGTCRVIPMLATDYNYQLIDLPDFKININPKLQTLAFWRSDREWII